MTITEQKLIIGVKLGSEELKKKIGGSEKNSLVSLPKSLELVFRVG